MKPFCYAIALVLAGATAVHAQSEAALRSVFEGRLVTVKMDMPATSEGVDVYPLESMPVDFRRVAERLKEHGTALRVGQQIMITKATIKSSHIELQLGAGGFGTFGDMVSSPSEATYVPAAETSQEKALREQIRQTTDRDKKRQLERELDALRSQRQRENARAEAEARHANEAREANLRARKAESGSRFNVRYRDGFPADAITPENIMRSLAAYLDFGAQSPPSAESSGTGAPRNPAGLSSIRKGLLIEDVEAMLGPALTASDVQEGRLTVSVRSYVRDGMKVTASFVSGVLIDFSITPR